jgi:hypothetical protein
MTDPDLTTAPSEVRALVPALSVAGFTVVSEWGGGAVNRVLELAGPRCRVRVTADRGQWWLDIGRPPEVDWYDTDVWTACLDGHSTRSEPSSLEEQVDFAVRRWVDVAAAGRDVTDRLAGERAIRARERLGLPPRIGEGN